MKILTGDFGKMTWNLGSCSSIHGSPYKPGLQYIERCCLEPGSYTLICENNDLYVMGQQIRAYEAQGKREVEHAGWYGGSIEIQGQKYCDDFVGQKAMRRVKIRGTLLDENYLIY